MANQVQIPVIQHPDSSVVQIQQNVNKVLRNINNQVSTSIDQSTIIGEVKSAFLTETQFQNQTSTNWVLCDGRNVKGSQYQIMTTNQTIPDMRSTVPRMKDNGKGLNPDGDLSLGSYQSDAYALHDHGIPAGGLEGYNSDHLPASLPANRITAGGDNSGFWNIHAEGSNETRAKSTTINFFIRIN